LISEAYERKRVRVCVTINSGEKENEIARVLLTSDYNWVAAFSKGKINVRTTSNFHEETNNFLN